jgi:hypothetical protein
LASNVKASDARRVNGSSDASMSADSFDASIASSSRGGDAPLNAVERDSCSIATSLLFSPNSFLFFVAIAT